MTTPITIPNPGFHLSSYTVYDRRGQSSGSYAVYLCDACAAQRRADGTMASKWSGECINGYCDDCKGGPSVSHYRLAPADEAADDTTHDPIGECVLCGAPAWHLDETLTNPLCPDHKGVEEEWIANRDTPIEVPADLLAATDRARERALDEAVARMSLAASADVPA